MTMKYKNFASKLKAQWYIGRSVYCKFMLLLIFSSTESIYLDNVKTFSKW